LRISKKKFIYLISPNKVYPQFYQDLKEILKTGKISLFQLRLKKYSFKQKILIGKKINQICKKNGVKFLGGVHGGDSKVEALKKVIDTGARIISGDDEDLAKEGRKYTNNTTKY